MLISPHRLEAKSFLLSSKHPQILPNTLAKKSGVKAGASTVRLLGNGALPKPSIASRNDRFIVKAAASPAEVEDSSDSEATVGPTFKFNCPVCLNREFALSGMPARKEGLNCERCCRTFDADQNFIDLTLTSGLKPRVYNQREWAGTEIFRSPFVSFAYERGWRRSFSWAGFPGEQKEYDMAMGYLEPVAKGKTLVDLSCGSGLFTRRFARSGSFPGVVAVDFSESMLVQAKDFLQRDGLLSPTLRPAPSTRSGSGPDGPACPVVLLRADVGRLPFPTGSVPAIHSGAAIHCWPNPQAAFAEISRVLAPGGIFVATTFLVATAPLGQVIGDDTVRPFKQLDPTAPAQQAYRWWEEAELKDLCASVGLQDFQRERQWRFIMFSVRKPE